MIVLMVIVYLIAYIFALEKFGQLAAYGVMLAWCAGWFLYAVFTSSLATQLLDAAVLMFVLKLFVDEWRKRKNKGKVTKLLGYKARAIMAKFSAPPKVSLAKA